MFFTNATTASAPPIQQAFGGCFYSANEQFSYEDFEWNAPREPKAQQRLGQRPAAALPTKPPLKARSNMFDNARLARTGSDSPPQRSAQPENHVSTGRRAQRKAKPSGSGPPLDDALEVQRRAALDSLLAAAAEEEGTLSLHETAPLMELFRAAKRLQGAHDAVAAMDADSDSSLSVWKNVLSCSPVIVSNSGS